MTVRWQNVLGRLNLRFKNPASYIKGICSTLIAQRDYTHNIIISIYPSIKEKGPPKYLMLMESENEHF